jgi:DinB family protein
MSITPAPAQFDLDDTVALLSRTPAALDALLRDLPPVWTHRTEGENTWTVFDVVVHLIHAERTNWIPRAKILLQFGETRGFDPFDRRGYAEESKATPLPQLLDEFVRLRAGSLSQLSALKLRPADLERRGSHPALGVVTLSELFAAWTAHDLTHLHQISRVMAYQYREAVGPWIKYIGVMHCAGHGA